MYLRAPAAAQRPCGRHPGEGCDCIAPLMPPKVPAQNEPERLNSNERMRLRAAAAKASRDYPGPVGKLVAREILAYEEFAWRYDKGGQMDTLVEHILKP